jgi:hypothetical protein
MDLVRSKNPEEIEAELKQREVALIETELIERELELATLQAELHTFERRYMRIVGVKLAQLDQIEAELAEAVIRLHPNDQTARENGRAARAHATESARATEGFAPDRERTDDFESFEPSDELKKLYREAAKKIHPDVAIDPNSRPQRERIMAEVNAAYEAGDIERLRQLLRDWDASAHSVEGSGVGAALIRLIRQIAQLRLRIKAVVESLTDLRRSDLGILMVKVQTSEAEGLDLLHEMAKEIDHKIAELRRSCRPNREAD